MGGWGWERWGGVTLMLYFPASQQDLISPSDLEQIKPNIPMMLLNPLLDAILGILQAAHTTIFRRCC